MYLVADAGNKFLAQHLIECESNTYPVFGQKPLHELALLEPKCVKFNKRKNKVKRHVLFFSFIETLKVVRKVFLFDSI